MVAALRSRPPTSPPDVIFVTARPPYRQLSGSTVSDIAKRALRRAGVTVPRPGAHPFRHAFASQMVRRDVPMKTVADLLGHAHLETTTIYAKLGRSTAVLEQLGVRLNPTKTRIVRVQHGFEFLGYKIKRGKGLRLPRHKIRTRLRPGGLYAYPTPKSLRRFKDLVRSRTQRKAPVPTGVLIQQLNPVLRGWGHYYNPSISPHHARSRRPITPMNEQDTAGNYLAVSFSGRDRLGCASRRRRFRRGPRPSARALQSRRGRAVRCLTDMASTQSVSRDNAAARAAGPAAPYSSAATAARSSIRCAALITVTPAVTTGSE